jgi:hypothetical protein
MGANAQTSVPTFTSGQVLTAAQQNLINTGVPVAAGTAERDALFGGADEKTLAEGQLVYVESLNVVQYYDGAAWATVGPSTPGGLVFIKSQTIGSAQTTVTVTDAFSSTYDNYRITITGGNGSTSMSLLMQLGATNTAYYWTATNTTLATGAVAADTGNNTSSWRVGYATSDTMQVSIDVCQPFLTEISTFAGQNAASAFTTSLGITSGVLNNTTSYTAFTVLPSTGNFTGGVIRVYGYANS